MSKSNSDINLNIFAEFVLRETGLYFSKERLPEVERNFHLISKELGFSHISSFVKWMTFDKPTIDQIKIIAKYLTVGETYFFREKETFEILKNKLIPEIISQRQKKNKTLRIWNAGCSSGEEPYSIAILLKRIIPDIKSWNISIIGTDINPVALKKAEEGIYTKWSFRENSDWIIDKYFNRLENDRFEIIPEIKAMVKFSHLNLIEDIFPSVQNGTNYIDLLFCRNVLMYFTAETAHKIIKRFRKSVTTEGWLILSSVEANLIRNNFFHPIIISGKSFYTKRPSKKLTEPIQIIQNEIADFFLLTNNELQNGIQNNLQLKETTLVPSDVLIEKPVNTETLLEQVVSEKKVKSFKIYEQLFESALFAFGQKKYQNAIDSLIAIISTCDDPNVFILLSRSYANLGKLPQALEYCNKAIIADKTNTSFYLFHGTLLQAIGNTEEALIAFRKVLYLNPDTTIAYFSIASIMQKSGNIQDSRKYFDKALNQLQNYSDSEILEASEGLTAGSLKEIILSIKANI